MKIAYIIIERGEKSYFTRAGVAFENNDGSLNVLLDVLPAYGQKIQIRDQEQKSEDDKPKGKRSK